MRSSSSFLSSHMALYSSKEERSWICLNTSRHRSETGGPEAPCHSGRARGSLSQQPLNSEGDTGQKESWKKQDCCSYCRCSKWSETYLLTATQIYLLLVQEVRSSRLASQANTRVLWTAVLPGGSWRVSLSLPFPACRLYRSSLAGPPSIFRVSNGKLNFHVSSLWLTLLLPSSIFKGLPTLLV